MLKKNLYNFLSINELTVYSYNYDFFTIKDSYLVSSNLISSKLEVFSKLVSKGLFKNILFFDNINIKYLKFPVFFYFFNEYILLEKLFLDFLSKTSIFIFFKLKNKGLFRKNFFGPKINSKISTNKSFKTSSQISLDFLKFQVYAKF